MSANDGVERGQVIHGARLHIRLNGKKVGYVQQVDATQQKNVGDVEALDDLLDVEHVVLGIKYNGQMRRVALIKSSLAAVGITKPIADVFAGGLDNVQFVDSVTGELWMAFQRITFSGWSTSASKGSPSVFNTSFKAISYSDGDGIHAV